MKAYELIEKAANLIKTTGWTQHTNARDIHGEPVNTTAELERDTAVCFCMSGAMRRVYYRDSSAHPLTTYMEAMAAMSKESGLEWDLTDPGSYKNVIAYNDNKDRTKEEVLEFMFSAAAKLKAKNNSIIL